MDGDLRADHSSGAAGGLDPLGAILEAEVDGTADKHNQLPAAANGLLPPLGYRRAEVAVEERAPGSSSCSSCPP
jgi:hypothetical protein